MEGIVRIADVGFEDVILEIGPGRGDLTVLLAKESRRVIAVEIDDNLATEVERRTESLENVDVIHGDALKVDFTRICPETPGGTKIVANLPYQISTPLLMRFLEVRYLFSTMVLMLQKEVALRVAASPCTKAYGSLSVLLQFYTMPTIEMLLAPRCFFPRPKVDSAVVRFSVLESPKVAVCDEGAFRRVVRASFGHRRKTLKNALRSVLPECRVSGEIESVMIDLGIDPTRRAETLTIEDFARLTGGLMPFLT
jgi:16S rRNA (adenine1518-N6/adenine1519-N6)-dimethyltransferase